MSDSRRACRGLRLLPGVIQPFLIRFRHDDLHIMAFFEGRPKYEAVEAMIGFRMDGEFSIRAILTRHDQSQIDYVNDDALLDPTRSETRETYRCPIALKVEPLENVRRARLEFKSRAGEHIILDVTTVGQPDPRRGGLTDPGGHSPTGALPLMWRGASTLAGPQTHVVIDSVQYGVPVKLRSDGFTAHEGYYTDCHCMGVIRAGSVGSKVLSQPDRIDVGAKWIFEQHRQEVVYQAMSRDADGQLYIARHGGSGETITAYAIDDQLEITKINLPADGRSTGGLALTFDSAGSFSLSIDEAQSLVTGDVEISKEAGTSIICLRPMQPGWAKDRLVRVACSREGESIASVTTIGPRH
jgi:hypothetical protein